MREKVAILMNTLHARLGGMLPLKLDDDLTQFTVRAISPQESLNYTVSRVLDLVGIGELLQQRMLSFAIAKKKSDSKIDMSQNNRYQFQPIVVHDFVTIEDEAVDDLDRYDQVQVLGGPVFVGGRLAVDDGPRARAAFEATAAGLQGGLDRG